MIGCPQLQIERAERLHVHSEVKHLGSCSPTAQGRPSLFLLTLKAKAEILRVNVPLPQSCYKNRVEEGEKKKKQH